VKTEAKTGTILEAQLLDAQIERKLAAHLFNDTWRLLDKTDRTAEEDARMIHSAHASRFHWEAVGNAQNRAVGEWQISRVYCVVGLRESALYHARLCMELTEANALKPFHMAFAHEGLARALSSSDKAAARVHYQAALDLVEAIEDQEDRNILQSDLQTIKLV
jgi:hypothetical protein